MTKRVDVLVPTPAAGGLRRTVPRLGPASIAGLLSVVMLAVAGCGSVTLPSSLPSNLPSISLPTQAEPTGTATVTLTRPASTVTVTDKATTTREATATETVTRKVTETVTRSATETRTVTAGASPTCQGSDCAGAPAETQGVGWVWPLLLLVAAAAAGFVAWRAVKSRQDWDRRYARARTELQWAESELVPRVLSAPTTAAAATQWEAGRTRVMLAAEELRLLSRSAPASGRAENSRALSTALAELTGALDADTALNPESDADTVRAAVVAVESARRALAAALNRAST